MKKKQRKNRILIILVVFIIIISPFIINSYMQSSTAKYILNGEDLEDLRDFEAECILVLGAGLRPDGTPNFMLQERLDKGIELYKNGAAPAYYGR